MKLWKKQELLPPEDAVEYAARYFSSMLMNEGKEHFWILLLDRKNRPIKHVEISVGSSIQMKNLANLTETPMWTGKMVNVILSKGRERVLYA